MGAIGWRFSYWALDCIALCSSWHPVGLSIHSGSWHITWKLHRNKLCVVLVGGIPTPLKNMNQLGYFSIPTCFWKVIIRSMVPVTTNQYTYVAFRSNASGRIKTNWSYRVSPENAPKRHLVLLFALKRETSTGAVVRILNHPKLGTPN